MVCVYIIRVNGCGCLGMFMDEAQTQPSRRSQTQKRARGMMPLEGSSRRTEPACQGGDRNGLGVGSLEGGVRGLYPDGG